MGNGDSRSDPVLARQRAAADTLAAIERDRARVPVSLRPLLIHLRRHLFDRGLTVRRLKQVAGIRDNAASTAFALAVGLPPKAYIERHRVEIAQRLLADSDLPLCTVGALVGFSGLTVFGAAFRRRIGEPPGRYRKRRRRAQRSAASSPPARPRPWRLSLGAETIEAIRAQAAWDAIRGKRFERQRAMVRGVGVASPAFFHLLRAKSRTEGRGDRRLGVAIARLALDSLEPAPGVASDAVAPPVLHARGLAWLGNAHRLALDFAAAERAFDHAQELLDRLPAAGAARAELLDLKAALRWYQTRFDEARQLEDLAIALLRVTGPPGTLSEALLTRATIEIDARRPRAAIADVHDALRQIDRAREPFRAMTAYQLLARAAIDAGAFAEAAEALDAARTFADRVRYRGLRHFFRWAEGLIAEGNGALELAERRLAAARQGFLHTREPYYCASVTIDLACVLFARGKTAETIALARQSMPVFDALSVHRERVGRPLAAPGLCAAALLVAGHPQPGAPAAGRGPAQPGQAVAGQRPALSGPGG